MTDVRHLDAMETEGLTPIVTSAPPPVCPHDRVIMDARGRRFTCLECRREWSAMEWEMERR